MKKVFLLLMALLLLSGTALGDSYRVTLQGSAADHHLEIDFTLQNNELQMRCNLFPHYVLIFPDRCIIPSGLSSADKQKTDEPFQWTAFLTEWIRQYHPKNETGIYAGDTFDTAAGCSSATLSVSELLSLADRLILQTGGESFFGLSNAFKALYRQIRSLVSGWIDSERDLLFDIGIYDGKYVSATLHRSTDEQVLGTFSANFSSATEGTAVMGTREEGKYYYRLFQYQYDGECRLELKGSLIRANRGADFRANLPDDPVCQSSLIILKSRESARFLYRFDPVRTSLGTIVLDGNLYSDSGALLADAHLHSDGQASGVYVEMTLIENPENETAELRRLNMENPDDRSEAQKIFAGIRNPVIQLMFDGIPYSYLIPALELIPASFLPN